MNCHLTFVFPLAATLCAALFAPAGASAQSIDQPLAFTARRVSSADPTGGNRDFVTLAGKASHTVAEIPGAGRIVHIWFTFATLEPDYLKTTRLKMFWDGQPAPGVDVPLGDFFALGHGTVRQVNSAFLTVEARPELNHNLKNRNVAGFNCHFPMPFARGARILIENGSDQPFSNVYYQIDWQQWPAAPSPLRFHASYRRSGASGDTAPSARASHLILDAQGRGHLAGVVLSVDTPGNGWWEGDETIVIDGQEKAAIQGTGTEDYFGGAYGFRKEYGTPWHGVSYLEKFADRPHWQAGKYTVYRFHQHDPIPFTRSLKMSIERGHANVRTDSEYATVAYWYQQ
jgi:hypothetical protein